MARNRSRSRHAVARSARHRPAVAPATGADRRLPAALGAERWALSTRSARRSHHLDRATPCLLAPGPPHCSASVCSHCTAVDTSARATPLIWRADLSACGRGAYLSLPWLCRRERDRWLARRACRAATDPRRRAAASPATRCATTSGSAQGCTRWSRRGSSGGGPAPGRRGCGRCSGRRRGAADGIHPARAGYAARADHPQLPNVTQAVSGGTGRERPPHPTGRASVPAPGPGSLAGKVSHRRCHARCGRPVPLPA